MKGVKYKNLFLFSADSTTVLRDLISEDGNPMVDLGFIFLLNLGITLTGFHDCDAPQKAITLFERGAYEDEAHRMKPFVVA